MTLESNEGKSGMFVAYQTLHMKPKCGAHVPEAHLYLTKSIYTCKVYIEIYFNMHVYHFLEAMMAL